MTLKAYIHPASPNCVAVLALANELGIEMRRETVDLFGQANLEPQFLAINPNGLVPVLDDDGYRLWETTAILQYLAATGGGAWLPQDERARADVTRWQAWGIAHWQPALQVFIFQNLFKRLRGLGAADPQIINEATPRLAKYAGILETVLCDREWLCGGQISVADLTVAAYLIYSEPADVPLAAYPHLLAWWSRLRQRPAWSAAEADVPRFG
jgi:glutathione S-transferase